LIEGQNLTIEFLNFGAQISMRCISAEDLRNVRPSDRQWREYHLTFIQVKISDTNVFKSECSDFKNQTEIQTF